ncbi:hypothetical protein G6F68_013249 [Rhizopus microsporus]|nr:hypothetical protein G6F68_013249 [Rhizopus microsporus]
MPRGGGPGPAGRSLEKRQGLRRCVACDRGRRAGTPGGVVLCARGQVPWAGGVAAGLGPAGPARHLPGWKNYRRFDWSVVGETACADSWGRALATGEPSLSLPCFAERRYGGVPDEEMLMALPPRYLPVAIAGMKALAASGLRYPIAPYGIQNDVRAGMGVSYAQTPKA